MQLLSSQLITKRLFNVYLEEELVEHVQKFLPAIAVTAMLVEASSTNVMMIVRKSLLDA